MSFDAPMMAGADIRLASISPHGRDADATGRAAAAPLTAHFARLGVLAIAIALVLANHAAFAQSMYKYRGADGEWIFSDRRPPGNEPSEIRELPKGNEEPAVVVRHRLIDRQLRFVARNDYHATVQLIIRLERLHNVEPPIVDESLQWILPARSSTNIMTLDAILDNVAPAVEYTVAWLPGDPATQHNPNEPYRAPFAVAREFTITQAFPVNVTHNTPDSRHAVDISMPIGTNVYAARAGTVFDVSSTNYRGGLDPTRDGAAANLIRILHDDGTFAVYAHLNWNTIRVRPGDVVQRGEYIADSGNTGFSTGPHLHFVVLRNRGLRLESVPITFEGAVSSAVIPQAGALLDAY